VREAAALAFVAAVAALAIYCARRPTIARGDVLADELAEQYRRLRWQRVTCDREVPIVVDGARFHCVALLADGRREHLDVALDRAGTYHLRGR
jgi:hypothetical protein